MVGRLQKRENESFYDWCDRLADELKMTQEQRTILHEVSKESWIDGVKTKNELRKKYG